MLWKDAIVSTQNLSSADTPENYHIATPTSDYSDGELAEIYNSARVDYIVPMPMNAKRMRQYIDDYNISLDASVVALDVDTNDPTGVIMLGIRDKRSWITRLGVIPEKRRRHTGQFLMNRMVEISQQRGMSLIQLEVIKGNDPARKLFEKMGFEVTRELLVIRRPPGKLDQALAPDKVVELIESTEESILHHLAKRESYASWVEETQSLTNSGNLRGLEVCLASGEQGWLVFQRSPFQLQHIVIQPDISHEMRCALLAQLHLQYPLQDTKIENVPVDHPTWSAYQQMGYFEAFRRIEMVLNL